MSETPTIFTDDDLATPVPAQTEQDKFLETLVGEGKKYSNAEELAKAYDHAEAFIHTLKLEKQGVEVELATAKAQKTAIDQLTEQLVPKPKEEKPETPVVAPAATGMTPEQIKELVQGTVQESETLRTAKANAENTKAEVWAKLAESLGSLDDAKAAARAYVGDTPAKAQVLDQLALTDVDALVTILTPHKPAPNTGGQAENLQAARTIVADVSGGLTWSKCQKIRRDNREQYNSREFQTMMHAASAADENFFNK